MPQITMKLNIKNTIFISLATVIWAIYLQLIDTTVQIVVVKNLGQTEEVKGIILGVISIMPVFLFPLFAKLSDNCRTKIGRRAPFIIVGTLSTVLLVITAGVFADKGSVVGYAVFFTLSYIGMGIYRPAATAILPDITPKPLRSRANAVKGIVNAFGGLVVLILVAVFGDARMLEVYAISAIVMVGILVSYILNINEPKLVEKAEEDMARYMGVCREPTANGSNGILSFDGPKGVAYIKAMPKQERRSLFLLLAGTFLVAYGYGAMISTYQNYAYEVWGMPHSRATIFILLLGLGGLVSTPLSAKLSDKFGRKNTVVVGLGVFMFGAALVMMLEHFAVARFFGFVLMGAGGALFNIIVFPMILELSNTQNNGVFTGYFTLATTIPKALTAYTSGVLLTRIGYHVLFPYTLVFISLAFLVMVFVRHGDVIAGKAIVTDELELTDA